MEDLEEHLYFLFTIHDMKMCLHLFRISYNRASLSIEASKEEELALPLEWARVTNLIQI